jgi:molybdopterin converting factor small subunit
LIEAPVMQVELRLLSGMKRLLPEGDRDRGFSRFEVTDGYTCAGLMELIGIGGRTLVVLVNGRHAEPDRELVHGDVVAVFPPVAGG